MNCNQQPTSFASDFVRNVTELRSLSTQNLIFDLILQKLEIFSHFISTYLIHILAVVLLL